MLDIGNGSGGDFTPWVKYNAKAGRWYIKGDTGDVEIQNPAFVADFANIKTGWFYFAAGLAPEKILDPSLSQRAEKPNRTYADKDGKQKDCFKRGFLLNVLIKAPTANVYELSSTAEAISTAISALYTQYASAPEKAQGLLPVVQVTGANPVTGKHGTNYAPVFQIVKWVARPVEFDAPKAAPVTQQAAPPPVVASVSEF